MKTRMNTLNPSLTTLTMILGIIASGYTVDQVIAKSSATAAELNAASVQQTPIEETSSSTASRSNARAHLMMPYFSFSKLLR